MSTSFTIIDPRVGSRVEKVRRSDPQLAEALTRTQIITVPESGVKQLVARNFENLLVDVAETGVYVINANAQLLRATIYAICTFAGSAGALQATLSWTARTKQPSPPAQTFSPTDVDLTAYGDVQYGEVIIVGEGPVTFAAEIVGGAGNPEYSVYLRIEEIGKR